MRIKSTIPQFVSQNCQIVQLITQFEFRDLYTPSPRWRSRTAWTSRPSAVCWATTRRGSRWTPTPTSPPMRSSRRRKRWAISYPVLSDAFRYPLPLGSAFGSEKSNTLKAELMKSKSPRNQTISRTFGKLLHSGYFASSYQNGNSGSGSSTLISDILEIKLFRISA